MKYIIKFNESVDKMTLSMEDVRNLKHNLDYIKKGDFIKNYGWNEYTKLFIGNKEVSGIRNGKKIDVYELHADYELGYAVSINGKIEYLIGIYKPYGFLLNLKRGLLTCWGYEEIIFLWLDDGEFEEEYIR